MKRSLCGKDLNLVDLKCFIVQLPVSSIQSAAKFKDSRGQAFSSLGIIGLQPPPDRFDWMSKNVSSC